MLMIRLARFGVKKRPFYRVVITDKRNRRDSGHNERVGYYNPVAAGKDIKLFLKLERIEHWVSKGAQMSEKVRYLVKEFKKYQKAAA